MARKSSGRLSSNPDNPQKFLRVSTQRYEEAEFLYRAEFYTVSIYIAGYSVECGLKALILSNVPEHRQADLAATFRGSVWHNLDWLVEVYARDGGPRPSRAITKDLTFVEDEWSVDLRYFAGLKSPRVAERFIQSAESIHEWVKGRL